MKTFAHGKSAGQMFDPLNVPTDVACHQIVSEIISSKSKSCCTLTNSQTLY